MKGTYTTKEALGANGVHDQSVSEGRVGLARDTKLVLVGEIIKMFGNISGNKETLGKSDV